MTRAKVESDIKETLGPPPLAPSITAEDRRKFRDSTGDVMIRRLLIALALMFAVLGTLVGSVIPASAQGLDHASPARARPLPVLYNFGGSNHAAWNRAQRRPAIFYLTADGIALLGDKAHHLKWTKWSRASAAATGRYYYRTGPCCRYHSRAISITANHVVRQNRRKSWYDRMTIQFIHHKPVTIQFKRINGDGFWQIVAGRFP